MINDGIEFDVQKILRLARQALSSSEVRRKFHRLDYWGPNEWYESQKHFFLCGATHRQRLIRGGNQSGKTLAASFETALHLTGLYPRWWQGKRFDHPIRAWIAGPSREAVREGPQYKLLGIAGAGGEFGSGMIPASAMVGLSPPVMIPGGGRCVDSFGVQHYGRDGKPNGISTAMYKSFEQGVEKFQGESVHVIWIDERCSEALYAENLARTPATKGIIYLSYTPLRGGGELTYRFLNEPNPDRCDVRIPGSEAVHIDPAKRESVGESLLEHERAARLEGIPQFGIARIFPVRLSDLTKQFSPDNDIPDTARWNVGLDFGGFNHPAAIVLTAFVPETDQFFAVDSQKLTTGDVGDHARAIAALSRGLMIPISWPHDGHQKQAAKAGKELADCYRAEGLPMMRSHVTNPSGGISVEPAIRDMISYMRRPGGFIIASHLSELLEEMASYHLDEKHNIVRIRDDLVSALRYSFMARRQGKILEMCEHYPRAVGVTSVQYAPRVTMADRQRMRPERFARGTPQNRPFDLFTGLPLD
jgi:phage terminase large subunit-like protein